MSIVYRSVKGSKLTSNEVDGNFQFLDDAIDDLEPIIPSGTTSQYWRGDKSWVDFSNDVRNALLTGLSTSTNASITQTDSTLSAFGKLQKQITDILLYGAYVTPEMYGAIGDGITDDSAAFIAIPLTAKYIILKTNATYLISKECLNSLVKSNTLVEGNFATFKRSNAVVTTLTSPAISGTTILNVASTAGWTVGDFITVTNNNAVQYAGKGDTENSNRGGDLDRIISIGANTLTINNASLSGLRLPENGELATQYAAGCNVIRTFNMWGLGVANNNIEWRNVIIDGNVSGNAYSYDWRINNTGAMEGENIKFVGCIFKNTPSENIICSGKIWFDKCYLENLSGGLMHGSTSHPTNLTNGYWVTNCKGKNVGQHAAEAGHSNSFVTFSASVQEVFILNNDIENELTGGTTKTNTGYCFGPIGFTTGQGDSYSDGKVYVRGNRFTNFGNISSIFTNTADLNQNVKNIHIEKNDFINCGDLLVRGNLITNGGGIRDIFVKHNIITNGRVFFESVYHLEFINNKLKQEETYSFPTGIIGLNNVNTVGHVYIQGSDIKIIGNTIIGKTSDDSNCKRGIFASSSVIAKTSAGANTNYGYYQDVQIHGNTVRNHQEFEIATSADAVSTARSLELVGWSVKNNNVYAQKSGSSTAQELIWVDPGVTCEGNKVYTFVSTQIGIRAFGINSSGPITTCKGAIVRNNEIYGPATSPIILQGNNNDYNNVITGNIMQVELSDPGAGKSIISNNILLLSTMGTPYFINEDEDTNQY